MVVAAYIRVSTDEQADKGNSLNEQKERLSAYCKAMGWDQPVFYIDEGYSAKDLRRPAIQKLINDVKQNKIKILLTSKLDRFARNLLDLLQTIELLTDHNCSYVSSSENFDTSTAVGRMTLQLLGTFAEFERERISERVKDNMLSLAKNTDRAITQACYGYDVIDGKYQINEAEAKGVKYMFELGEQGHGHRMVAKMMNDHGYITKRGKMWDQVNIKRLMKNEAIIGTLVYNKRSTKGRKVKIRDEADWVIKENNHPAIISKELFERVQEIMSARSTAGKHADNETYLLTGLLKCGHCKSNMKGMTSRHQQNKYVYYRYICSSYSLGYGCKHHAIHRDDIENLVIGQIKELIESSEKKLDIKISPKASAVEEIKEVRNQLVRSDRRMQKQIEAYEMDLISDTDLKAARVRIDSERDFLNQELERLNSRKSAVIDIKIKAKRLFPDILSEDRIKAKGAIRQLIDRIEVLDGELVDIIWK